MTFYRAALAALFSAITALGAQAQDITLTSHDGKIELSGNLLGFDGEFYRVQTQFGELTVDGSGVTCSGPACPTLTDFVAELRFAGSSVMAERVLPALIAGFAKHENLSAAVTVNDQGTTTYELSQPDRAAPLARFLMRSHNTAQGFSDMIASQADIVMARREVRPAETETAISAGFGDLSHPRRSRIIALDALVPLVADDNPMQQIAPRDLVAIFGGDITNWAELGGPDAPIAVHLPANGSGLAQGIEDQVLKPVGVSLGETVIRHDSSAALVRAVMRDPFAIGMANRAEAQTARALALSGGCGHALVATRQAIKTEDYPLTSPMFLYLPQHRLPRIARQFLAFSQSPEAQMAIRKAGFVDQNPETLRLGLQGDRLANAVASGGAEVGLDELQRMVNTLRPMSRLSMSFRFQPGSSRPDAQSQSNIRQLALQLETGAIDAQKLSFIGFSDGDGPAAGNARIALLRAQTVRNAVLAAVETAIPDTIDITVDAFGEAMPMACDDSEWGRKINRRVEVWVQ